MSLSYFNFYLDVFLVIILDAPIEDGREIVDINQERLLPKRDIVSDITENFISENTKALR